MELPIEFTACSVLVKVVEADDMVVVVECLQLISARALHVDKVEPQMSKRMILRLIGLISPRRRFEMIEEMLHMTFDEQKRIAVDEKGQLEIDALLLEILD